MQAVITVATMRESDAYTIAKFVPSKTLMYRAAMGVYQAAQWKGPVGILTGGGNNGGDGYALAGILADHLGGYLPAYLLFTTINVLSLVCIALSYRAGRSARLPRE